jgi:Protein tyrosine/serine phosphatase
MKTSLTASALLIVLSSTSVISTANADIASASALQAKNGVLADYRRLLPLEGGSNFRDMGGYPTESGKTVKRGLLFRSGAPASLTAEDEAYLSQFGFESVMDLRSSEEIELFPNRWATNAGIDYYKHDYSIVDLLSNRDGQDLQSSDVAKFYPDMAQSLKPQLKQYFTLLADGKAPIMVNCSAGQDRTGITSALLLSVLGVPRQLVIEDYLLSTDFRRPVIERGNVDIAAHAQTNAFAALMSRYEQAERTHATPLVTADGTPYLEFALRKIENDYGSVEAFLTQEVGISDEQLNRIRTLYLQ